MPAVMPSSMRPARDVPGVWKTLQSPDRDAVSRIVVAEDSTAFVSAHFFEFPKRWQAISLCAAACPQRCYEDLKSRNSAPHAMLNSRKKSISALSRSFGTSRNVLLGARYVSMISRTTLSAFSVTFGAE